MRPDATCHSGHGTRRSHDRPVGAEHLPDRSSMFGKRMAVCHESDRFVLLLLRPRPVRLSRYWPVSVIWHDLPTLSEINQLREVIVATNKTLGDRSGTGCASYFAAGDLGASLEQTRETN